MAMGSITPSVVRTWWARLPADKPTVRARSYALLKAVMNTAVADEVIDSNPCRIRGAPTLLGPGRSDRRLSRNSR